MPMVSDSRARMQLNVIPEYDKSSLEQGLLEYLYNPKSFLLGLDLLGLQQQWLITKIVFRNLQSNQSSV